MKSLIAALLLSAALAGSASAATTPYTDATAFATAAGILSQQNFDGQTLGRSLAGTVDFGAFSTTLTSIIPGPRFNVVGGPGALNAIGLSGRNLQVGLLNGETLKITFDNAITAFGAMFAGVNDRVVRSSFNGGGTTAWLERTGRNDRGARFFGIVSDTPFTEVTFTGGLFSEGFGIDDVRWAFKPPPPAAVPLPASGVLLMGAMLLAGLLGRRRARA